jgi:hypothetical protein
MLNALENWGSPAIFSDLERSGELIPEADSEDDEEISKASREMSDNDNDDESVRV